jgi:hypothetical protein
LLDGVLQRLIRHRFGPPLGVSWWAMSLTTIAHMITHHDMA